MYNTLYHQTKQTSGLLWLLSAGLTSLCPLTVKCLEAFSMTPPLAKPNSKCWWFLSLHSRENIFTTAAATFPSNMHYCRAWDCSSGGQSQYPFSVVTKRKKSECWEPRVPAPLRAVFVTVKAWKCNSCFICQSCKFGKCESVLQRHIHY